MGTQEGSSLTHDTTTANEKQQPHLISFKECLTFLEQKGITTLMTLMRYFLPKQHRHILKSTASAVRP